MSTELTKLETLEAAITRLEKEGLDYGSYFPMELIRKLAGAAGKDDVKFAWFKAALSASLNERGLHLTEANLNGQGVRVYQAVENFHACVRWMNRVDADHRRAITLLENTDQTRLTDAEKQRDANLLREIQHRRMMLRRQDDVVKLIKRHKPALLKEDVEAEVVSESSAKVS